MIDVDTLDVTLARAGHPSPVLIRADGTIELLQPDGSLLGIFPGEVFENGTVRLAPGDRLLIYTDGVEVAFAGSPSRDEPVEPGRWRDELYRRRSMTAEEMLTDFAEHLDRESGSLQPKDDLTITILEVRR
jgi:sigma-B regulation protein RsbU (phosphoserine phosphatase)